MSTHQYLNILQTQDILDILNLPEVIQAKNQLDDFNTKIYFSINLGESVKKSMIYHYKHQFQ